MHGLLVLESDGTDVLRQLGILKEINFQKTKPNKTSKIFRGLIRGARSFVISNSFEANCYDYRMYFQNNLDLASNAFEILQNFVSPYTAPY